MAGLEVPSPTLQRVSEFLDTVAVDEGSFYKYQPIRQGFTPAMTAEGLLCRQYLGWKQDDRATARRCRVPAAEHRSTGQIATSTTGTTPRKCCITSKATTGKQWNRVMRQVVPENQVLGGKEEGSWDPDGDRWGNYGGRLYVTCLSTYMLEVYYRHLPIYLVSVTSESPTQSPGKSH